MTATVEAGSSEPVEPVVALEPSPVAPSRRWPVPVVLVVAVLFGQMAVQLVVGLQSDTATYDEPINVRSGLVYATQGDLTPNPEHPPFTKLLSGWTVRALRDDPRADESAFSLIRFPRAPEYGERALATAPQAQGVVQAGRVPMVVLTLLLGLVVLLFASDLFGPVAGVVSLAVYSLAPQIIGHGHLATNDLPAAGFVVTSLWVALRLSRTSKDRPAARRAWLAAAGVALGLGLSTKYQVLIYAPAVVGAVGLAAWWAAGGDGIGSRGAWLRVLRWTGLVVLTSVAVVWGIMLLVDVQGALHPLPNGFGEQASGWSAAVVDRLPLPAAYRSGLRYQLGYSEVPKHAFLLGESYWGHVFWYQPLVLTMKYPLATLALWVAGVVAIVRRRNVVAALLILAPAALVLGVGMAFAADIGDRYVIAAPVLLAVAAGAAFAGIEWPRSWREAVKERRLVVGGVGLALVVASSVLAAPHDLAYMNVAWGGTDHAYERVADSAVDWGQDLGRLQTWIKHNAAGRPVYLSYFGTTDPRSMGVNAITITPQQADATGDGVVAVSVTEYNRNRFWFASLGPVRDMVGGSILIFEPCC